MSRWTKWRDALETGAAIVSNYFYPGSGLIGARFNSRGSREQLASDWGRGALLLSGLGGGVAGNLANYGTTFNAMTGAAGGARPSAFAGSAAGFGAGVGGGAGFGAEATPFGVTPTEGTMFGGMDASMGGGGGGLIESGGGSMAPTGWEAPNNVFSSGPYGGAGGPMATPAQLDMAQNLINSGYPPMDAYQQAGVPPQQAAGAGLPAVEAGAAPTFSGQTMAGAEGSLPATTEPGGYFRGVGSGGNTIGPMGNTLGPQQVAAAKQAGAMPWGSFGNVANVASGVYGLMQSQQMAKAAQQAQAAADPFSQYRKYYADQMQAMQNDPSMLQRLPGYQAGQQAIMRSMAAQGYTGSGNMMAAMQKYGGDFYNQTLDRYAQLAGAGANPATAAQIGLGGRQYGIELAGRSLGTLGYAGMMANNNPYDYNRYGQQQSPSWMGGRGY